MQHPIAHGSFSTMAGEDTFDGRSDNKGPEPEGLAMAEIDGRYAFTYRLSPSAPTAYIQARSAETERGNNEPAVSWPGAHQPVDNCRIRGAS